MKKILLIIISLLTIITLTGCTNNRIGEKTPHKITNDKITMEVKQGTLTTSSATIIMTNKTDEEYTYGEPYHLEIKHNDSWHILELEPNNDMFFTMPAYSLKAGESVEKEYNWEYGYGKLKKGTYRLVTDFSKEQNKIYVAAEFTIK